MKYVLSFLSAWTWEIPQTFLGLLLYIYFLMLGHKIGKARWYRGRSVINFGGHNFLTGATLGYFTFLPATFIKNRGKVVKHEHGHKVQSMILGPFYLLAIGIPIYINNLRARRNRDIAFTYYERYPEKWADNLGNVNR